MSEFIKGINGEDLPIKSEIYDDRPNIGKKSFILAGFRDGMYGVLTEQEANSLRLSVGITDEEYAEAIHESQRSGYESGK